MRSGLPVRVAAFVGREPERAKMVDLLADTRVVTLTGPGGCGKTRLAVEVAGDVASRFSDGAWWVDLQGVSEPGLVAPTIGAAANVHERSGQALTDTLVEQLRARQVLVVLDNCEHLVEACAELVGRLSSTCPQNTGQAHRTAEVLFDVAVDRDSGALYAVWQDRRFTGQSAIAFAESTDGGFTWIVPVRVNQTPAVLDGALDGQAFIPSVHVSDDGTVGVSYYDFRNNAGTDASATLTDHWLVHCHNACGDPASWGNEVRITPTSLDARKAPFARGFFLGDYVGLANQVNAFTSLFIQGVSDTNPTDAFYSRID